MTSAIVLAAGLSTRMGGRPKGLLVLDNDDTFVTRIIRTFNVAGIDDVVVVVGHEADQVGAVVERSGLSARTTLNVRYKEGQLSSIHAGLKLADRPDVDAVFLALVDAPLFHASTVRALLERFERTHAPIVRAVRGRDEHGHPVLISRALFTSLWQADPARGAKPIVRGHASPEGDVVVDDPGAFIDIDTPEDYEKLAHRLRSRA
jgi:CTP:molybdopterin cytidylyltransferase MocA